MKRQFVIEVVKTPTMYYVVVNKKIDSQFIPMELGSLYARSTAFKYCQYYGKCIAIEWEFNGSREELEAKLKQ